MKPSTATASPRVTKSPFPGCPGHCYPCQNPWPQQCLHIPGCLPWCWAVPVAGGSAPGPQPRRSRLLTRPLWCGCQLLSINEYQSFFFYYYYYSFSLQPNVPLKTKQILTISLQLMGKKKIYSSGIWHKIKEKAKPDLYFQSSSFGCWRYFSKIFPITAPHCLLQTPQLRSTGACSQLGYFILKSFS